MSCLFPISGWRSATRNENGNRPIVFSLSQGDPSLPVKIPCGRCINCRLNAASSWAIRAMHEAHYYDYNSFITLTFSDEYLYKRDNPMSVCKKEVQDFLKRLRDRMVPPCPFPAGHELRQWWLQENSFRYMAVGEYGENYQRPHYHLIIFNMHFPDRELWQIRGDYKLYRSKLLEELWPYGFSSIGSVTLESAGYTARYCTKKLNGDHLTEPDENGLVHYERINPLTGEVRMVEPEFMLSSRNRGLGFRFYEEWKHEIYKDDRIRFDNKAFLPPKYYDKLYKDDNPAHWKKITKNRVDKMNEKIQDDNTPSDLQRYRVAVQKFKQLVRDLE